MNFYTEKGGGDHLTTPPCASNVQVHAHMAGGHPHQVMEFPAPHAKLPPKNVAFELLVANNPKFKARLPMRVQIYEHDTTESIITTVKNFYGLYNGPGGSLGVSFEDEHGNTLIARYQNFRDKMNVYVRVIENDDIYAHNGGNDSQSILSALPVHGQPSYFSNSNQMLPPQHQALSRPDSRASHGRSVSPGRGRRSGSATASQQGRNKRPGNKSRPSSTHGSFNDMFSDGNGYSSGDGASGSVSSRSRGDIGNTEISLDNIVEGGRRKRAKFESSELPLFAPPQMPAATSNSSVSPARRMENQRAALPFTHPGQHPFAQPHMLHSPQSYNTGFAQPGPFVTPNMRARGSMAYPNSRGSVDITPNSNGLLPTPDPTIGSCMSEEDKDVALQLMRLGGMSTAGRTSTSTMDDTFSGRADAASSAGATSDEEGDEDDELPPARCQKLEYSPILPPGAIRRFPNQPQENIMSSEYSGEEDDNRDGTFKPEYPGDVPRTIEQKPRSRQTSVAKSRKDSTKPKSAKAPRSTNGTKKSASSKTGSVGGRQPMSPASLSNHSRKTSVASALNFQHQLGEDEEDLSSKPRCQRCRKSKKGCDRQRPCQRCKDAGLSAEQCVSEDEGNGRKGRYGRHMGVKVKKDDTGMSAGGSTLVQHMEFMPNTQPMMDGGSPVKGVKRKR